MFFIIFKNISYEKHKALILGGGTVPADFDTIEKLGFL